MITYKAVNYSETVFTLVRDMLSEIDYDYVEADVRKSLLMLFEMPTFTCIGAYDENDIVGVLGFFVMPQLHNYADNVASEQFWYTLPKYRGKVDLIKYLENNFEVDILEFGTANPLLLQYLKKRGFSESKTLLRKVLLCAEEHSVQS